MLADVHDVPAVAATSERPVTFFADGVRLRGHLTTPEGARGLPAIVLCHGFLCTMAMDLPDYARRLAGDGFTVLRFDYRSFGESDGSPRGELLPLRQSDDVRAAVSFLSAQLEVDPSRIALWGTSFGGAVVLHAAAHDERVCAVVANVPVTNGRTWIRSVNTDESWAAVEAALEADRVQRALTGASEVVPVSAFRPPVPDPDRDAFVARHAAHAAARELSWACVDAVLDFAPDELAARIAPRPLLLIATPSDTTVPAAQAESAYAQAREPKRLVLLADDVSHFAVYLEPALTTVLAETVAWLRAAPAVDRG